MSPQHKLEVEGKRHRQERQSLNLHLKEPDTNFWGAHVETRRCAAHAMYYILVSMYIRRPWPVLCTDLYVDTGVEICGKGFNQSLSPLLFVSAIASPPYCTALDHCMVYKQ